MTQQHTVRACPIAGARTDYAPGDRVTLIRRTEVVPGAGTTSRWEIRPADETPTGALGPAVCGPDGTTVSSHCWGHATVTVVYPHRAITEYAVVCDE